MTELLTPALSEKGRQSVSLFCATLPQKVAEKLLIREKVYHVNQLKNFEYMMGTSENISISNSFSMTSSYTDSHSQTN